MDDYVLNFCKANGVEVYTIPDVTRQTVKILMKRGRFEAQTEVEAWIAVGSGFGLTGRVILRELLRKIEQAEQEGNDIE